MQILSLCCKKPNIIIKNVQETGNTAYNNPENDNRMPLNKLTTKY